MFLKRLETIGFKSFAERIQMDFVPGVTAVVGPNGSGKSNVIDAIRWVLGEQSAKSLRGQRMEDIIFQGSDTRKALNFAEVSLILNNEQEQLPIDYQEVDVTRRIYRSGESEFYINKQACRLKDIIELFMDTGLGKESFSIIGQGRIDEILSSKAEERRAVFEEAAGVLKYKQRKKKAEFKLMETADNLDRAEDILHEINGQLGPLEKQAEMAEKYKVYKEQLKETEVSLLVTEIEQIHETWQDALKKVKENEQIELEKKAAIQQKDAMLMKDREAIQQMEHSSTKLQHELLEMTEQLKQHEGKLNVLLERAKHENENKEKLTSQAEISEGKLVSLNKLLVKENKQLDEVTDESDSLKDEISSLEMKLGTTPEELEAMIDNLKSEYIEQLNKQAVTKNEHERLEEQLRQLKSRQQDQKATYDVSLKAEKTLADEKETYSQKLDSLKHLIEQQEVSGQDVLTELEEARNTLEEMQQKLSAGNEQIARLSSRKEMLEEMKDSYQGFYFGAKEILQAKNRGDLTNILGAVIDLIQIPAPYMMAMETVLGAQAQYIVVGDDEAARKGINWLKRENKGRATFLPIKSIVPKCLPSHLKEQLKEQQGFIGIASELIEADNAYDKLKKYLAGNVLVADNLSHANDIAMYTNRKYRIVTLEGDIVFPGGSMSGGAKKKNNQSLFTREKEIVEVTEKLKDYTKRAAEYEQKTEIQKEKLQRLNKTRTDMSQALEDSKTKFDEAQAVLHEISLKYSRASGEVNNYRTITQQYKIEQNNLMNRQKELLEKREVIKKDLLATEAEMEELSARKKSKELDERKAEGHLHELKIKQAEQEERRKAIQERYETLHQQYKDENIHLQNTKSELAYMMNEAERKQLEQSISTKIDNLTKEKEVITVKLESEQAKRDNVMQRAADEEQEAKGMRHELEAFSKELQKQEVHANRLDVTLENYLNRLQSTYKITYERARETYDNVKDVKEAQEQVEVLKNAIERLGTVNLGAIEEFERLSEREEFLRTQQKDLLEAKETLYNVIREMDTEMTKRFSEVFEEIQGAFSHVFKELFGGGHATLSLTDPEEMLETGIDIAARPPGKKLKTLGLLSGGERALTAIALLFAILHVRPVPFCILDEVDAALDEANVVRFGKYLRTFSKDTQFIVITHRKSTMEEVDALYGITMQESGVSRLVSVKLEEAKPLVETS